MEQTDMQGRLQIIAGAVGIAMLATFTAQAADDGKAAFARREDTMKKMGRALYTTIGRVARGKAEPGPEAVAAAETVVSLSGSIATLFPPGSDIGESRVKPEIFAAKPRIEQLVAEVQAKAATLVPAARSGDRAAIATAFEATNDACEACHREFRKPE
jgi:cytochrome c556